MWEWGFLHLTFAIDRALKVICHPVDSEEHNVRVPTPLARLLLRHPTIADIGGRHRAEPIPLKPQGFVANVGSVLVEQVLEIAPRQRNPNIHHVRRADDLAACLELPDW
jgi:hypothetical protein